MQKKNNGIIAIVMSICLLFSMLPLTVNADGNETTNRYTVLVLDTSASSNFYSYGKLIYTADTAIDYVKKASKKFLSDITKANDNNYVAVVSYKSDAEVVSDFTQDTTILNSAIDNLTDSGTRSISDGLKTADSLLANVSDTDAIKNIVIFTTGMTNDGDYDYSGHYNEDTVGSNWYRTDNNVHLYAYANVAYEKAQEIKEKGSYIYSIGLFQTMEGMPEEGKEVVELFKLTASELASGQDYFYSVDDPDDLEFVFGEVADNVVNGNKDNDPIIVIPGVMGSRLFTSDSAFDDTTKAWDPVVSIEGVTQLNERLDLSNTLYVRPCENQNIDLTVQNDTSTVDDYGREYGAQGAYENIINSLCEAYSYENQDTYRPVYMFSYDWRYSNEDSAKLLKEEIDKIINETGASKVDFVCHSMGGLVASSYYNQFSDEGKVDKIITCGTPYEGAPKLLNAVENWDALGTGAIFSQYANLKNNAIDIVLGLFGGMTKELKSTFSGVAELTPTKNYVNTCPMQKDSKWPFNLGDYSLSYDEYTKQCQHIFTQERYDNAVNFQNSLLSSSGYNKLLEYDKSYFSVGINHATICAVKFQCINDDIDERLYESDLEYTVLGDGTVPYLSSSIMKQIESLSEQGIRWNQFDADHGETINCEDAIKWIKDILETGESDVVGAEKNNGAHTVVRIACPVDVSIEVNGEKITSNKDGLSSITDFGRLDFVGQEDEIKMVCFNDNGNYDISIHGTDKGTMDYTIRFYDDNEVLYDERYFEDVPISENTIITTGTDKDNDTVLLIDEDGDGEIDNSWTAEDNEKVTEADNVHTHNYNEPDFNWSEDYVSCTATFVCQNKDDTQTVDCVVTSKTTNATTTEDGQIVYTATVEFKGQVYTNKRTVVIPAKETSPDNPDDSNKPSQDETVNSTTPTTQDKADSATSETSVNTGDATNVALWAALLLLAILGIVISLINKKRRNVRR